MSNPIVTNIYPLDGATAISIADVVLVTFDQALDPDSVSPLTIILCDSASFTSVPATVTYSSATLTARLAPYEYLDYDTEYTVTVVGRDLSENYGSPITDINGNWMATTRTWSFTTQLAGTTPLPTSPAASSIVSTAPPFTPTDHLRLLRSYPADYQSNVPTDISYIALSFNHYTDIATGLIAGDIFGIDDTATRQERYEYFAEITKRHILYSRPGYTETMDGWGYLESGPILYIYPSDSLEENMEYTVQLRRGMPAVSSWALAEDVFIMFTTTMEPMFTTPDVIRINPIGPLVQNIPDDTINRLIYERSIEASSLYPGGVDMNVSIPRCVHDYVTCAVKLDAIQAALARMIGSGGQTKLLGDMRISYDLANATRAARDLMDPLQKCKDKNYGLVKNSCEVNTMEIVVKAEMDPRRPIGDGVGQWRRLGAGASDPFDISRSGRPSAPRGLGF